MLSDLNEVSSDPPIVENVNPSFNNADSFANIDDVPLDVFIRSILISRAKTGATIQDLRSKALHSNTTVISKKLACDQGPDREKCLLKD